MPFQDSKRLLKNVSSVIGTFRIMEALRYKLFSLYLGAMLRLQEANDEGIVYTRRIDALRT